MEIAVGKAATYTIGTNALTDYTVTGNTNPTVASITPDQIIRVTDGEFEIEGLGAGTTTIQIFWDARKYNEELDEDTCVVEVTVTAAPSPDLTVSKVTNAQDVKVGEPIVYSITVANTGSGDAPDVTLTDALPAEVSYVSADASQGDCSASDGMVSCALGTVPAQGDAEITITVQAETAGTAANSANVSGGGADPVTSQEVTTTIIPLEVPGRLKVRKTLRMGGLSTGVDLPRGSAIIDGSYTFRITVTNTSTETARNVIIEDELPSGIVPDDSDYASTPSCPVEGIVLRCEIDELVAGESVTVTFPIKSLKLGMFTNTAFAESDNVLGGEGSLDFEVIENPFTTNVEPESQTVHVEEKGYVTFSASNTSDVEQLAPVVVRANDEMNLEVLIPSGGVCKRNDEGHAFCGAVVRAGDVYTLGVEITATLPGAYELDFVIGDTTATSTVEVPSVPELTKTSSNHVSSGTLLDPVNTFTGELFFAAPAYLNLRGPLPLAFRRYYASFLAHDGKVAGSLGPNWSHSFDGRLLRLAPGIVELISSRGRATTFESSEGEWVQVDNLDVPFQLIEDAGGFVVGDLRTQRIYTFDAEGRLTEIADGRGNALALTYDGDGRLSEVDDGLGATLSFSYAGDRLTAVTDGTRTVSFTYSAGVLASATDPLGHTTTYSYDDAGDRPGLLTAMTRPEGNARYTQDYDEDGRVTRQTTALGNTYAMSYNEDITTATDPLGQSIQHTHTAAGELTAYTDETGQTVELAYDEEGQRTSVTDRMGATTAFTFHGPSGLPASSTVANGAVTTFTYTPRTTGGLTFYDLTGVGYADGTSVNMSYDDDGNLTSSTDRAGAMRGYTYNERGEMVSATNPEGGVTTFAYNADGTLVSIQDPSGNTTTFAYDGLRRLVRATFPDGTNRTFAYDAADRLTELTTERGTAYAFAYDDNGNLTSVTDPAGRSVRYAYDAMDRIVQVTDRLDHVLAIEYDALGRMASRTDRTGATMQFGYDAHGHLTSVTDGGGQMWTMAYDDEGVLTGLSNPSGETTTFATNAMGWPTQVTSPMGHSTQLVYDVLGRVTSLQDPRGATTTLSRESRGLLDAATLPGGASASYDRDGFGLLTAVTDPNSQSWDSPRDDLGRTTAFTDPLGRSATYAHDARSRVVQIEQPRGLGAVSLTYDGASNLTGISHSDGTTLSYSYDDHGRIVEVTGVTLERDALGRIVESNGLAIGRDAEGRITSVTLPAGEVTYGYDARGLLTEVTDWMGGTNTFTYDAAGRRTLLRRPNGVATRYTYDADGRLTSIEEMLAGDDEEVELAASVLERDARGQITRATRDVPLMPTLTPEQRTYRHDAASQVEGWNHDALGRRTDDDTRTYMWDGLGRLTRSVEAGAGVQHDYDGFGQRVSRTVDGGATRSYVWNYALGLPSVAVERSGSSATHYNVHTPGGDLLYRVDAETGMRRYYHYDEVGNTQFVTGDAGEVIAAYAYSPYGEVLTESGETYGNPFAWQGQFGVMQEADDLYYVRARYYDAESGRFLSRDPVKSTHPATINPYQYARGIPGARVDPTGRRDIHGQWGIAVRSSLKNIYLERRSIDAQVSERESDPTTSIMTEMNTWSEEKQLLFGIQAWVFRPGRAAQGSGIKALNQSDRRALDASPMAAVEEGDADGECAVAPQTQREAGQKFQAFPFLGYGALAYAESIQDALLVGALLGQIAGPIGDAQGATSVLLFRLFIDGPRGMDDGRYGLEYILENQIRGETNAHTDPPTIDLPPGEDVPDTSIMTEMPQKLVIC